MTREQISQAVARGWCHPKNEHKEMDADLAFSIVDEVEKTLLEDKSAYLGCATTEELLEELQVRAEVGGYATYRTIDGD